MNGFQSLVLTSCLVCGGVSIASAQSPQRTPVVINIDGENYYVHKLVKGDTFFHLSQLYGVSIDEIKRINPGMADGLKADMSIKIPYRPEEPRKKLSARKMAKLFDEHTVNRGETGYSIARRYSIAFSTLLEDNPGVDFTRLPVGQKLRVRKSEMGDSSLGAIREDLDEYRDALNSVTAGYDYHVVGRGETLYSLSKAYGVSVDSLKSANDLQNDAIQVGAMLKIPVEGKTLGAVPSEAEVSTPDPVREKRPEDAKVPEYTLFPGARDRSGLKHLSSSESVDVALLLPFTSGSGKPNRSMAEFYQGALLALEDLKAGGADVALDVYDTKRSAEEVERIVSSPDFAATDIIIGPVYEEAAAPAVDFAVSHRIAMVSPLASMSGSSASVVYQMAPDDEAKYRKLAELVRGGEEKNVVFVSGDKNDSELEREMKSLFAGVPYKEYRYVKGATTADRMADLIANGENLFVVLATDEISSEQILAAISSAHNNLTARSLRNADISVAAPSHWARFSKIDKNLFFKLKVAYVTSYHADRNDKEVQRFDNRYIKAYGVQPSLYSYRGYDAVKMFAGSAKARGDNFAVKLENASPELLQMPYKFGQREAKGMFVNDEWALVRYLDNYTIEVR